MKISHPLYLPYILFFILLLSSCKNQSTKDGIDSYFDRTVSLEYDQVLLSDFIWGHPLDLLVTDSVLFVYDEKNSSGLFHILNIKNPIEVLSFGKKGQGANEFIMPFDFQTINDNKIAIFDYMRKSLYMIDLFQVQDQNYNFPIIAKDTIIGTIKMLPSIHNSLVKLGFYDDCMFRLDMNSQHEKKYGEYPYKDLDEKRIENRMRGMAYQGMIRLNPNRDKFVFGINRADIIYFYQIQPEEIILRKLYELTYPKYKPDVNGESRSAAIAANNNRTFISIYTSNKYVYALYSGKNMQDSGMKSLEGDVVYIFDWEGNPIKKLNLNIPVTLICVNNENSELYAFSNMPDPMLIKFNLTGL